MSVLCQIGDISPGSFNHLVCAVEQRRRHGEAERLGGRKIDHKPELSRRLNLAWLRRPGTYTRCAVRAPVAVAVLSRYDALRERAGGGREEALPIRQQTS
jgi:hypothetical protein